MPRGHLECVKSGRGFSVCRRRVRRGKEGPYGLKLLPTLVPTVRFIRGKETGGARSVSFVEDGSSRI